MSDAKERGDTALEMYGPKPPRVFAPPWLGRRFTRSMRERTDGTFVATPTNKAFRRSMRKRLMESGERVHVGGRSSTGRVDASIKAWREIIIPHVAGLNSHAKKRELAKVESWMRNRVAKEAEELDKLLASRKATLAGRLSMRRTSNSTASPSSTPSR